MIKHKMEKSARGPQCENLLFLWSDYLRLYSSGYKHKIDIKLYRSVFGLPWLSLPQILQICFKTTDLFTKQRPVRPLLYRAGHSHLPARHVLIFQIWILSKIWSDFVDLSWLVYGWFTNIFYVEFNAAHTINIWLNNALIMKRFADDQNSNEIKASVVSCTSNCLNGELRFSVKKSIKSY